jgi:hypothetical protein
MDVGARILKLFVVLLCTINAAMWQLYTQMPMMALAWTGVAIGFVFWIMDDIRRQ